MTRSHIKGHVSFTKAEGQQHLAASIKRSSWDGVAEQDGILDRLYGEEAEAQLNAASSWRTKRRIGQV